MGKTLGFIGDRVEAAAHVADVIANEPVSPHLLRLVLRSDDFTTASMNPCDVTAFRTSRTDFRHYTPASLDHPAGELTIVVHRHGDAPGARLTSGWIPGDTVRVCQWSSTRAFHWLPGTEPVVVIGDATVIGLVIGAADRAEAEGRDFRGLVEVPEADVEATQRFAPKATVVAERGEPGAAMDEWLADHADEVAAVDPAIVYLAGHGQSIQRQRNFLRDHAGIDRRRIKTQPYWATGKSGL